MSNGIGSIISKNLGCQNVSVDGRPLEKMSNERTTPLKWLYRLDLLRKKSKVLKNN